MGKFDNQQSRGFKRSQNGNFKHTQSDSRGCFKCGEEGHFARDCTTDQSKYQKSFQPVSLEFPDYGGEKLHELPDGILNETLSKRPTETDVGISTYLNNDESIISKSGFTCILKHRYSDFNVNEIDPDGTVVCLTDTTLPSCDEKQSLAEKLSNIKYPAYNELPQDIKKWVTPINWSRLLIYAKKFSTPEEISNMPSNVELIRIDVTDSEKEERKILHTWVKEQFPHLNSDGASQSNVADKKYIVLSYAKTDKFQTSDTDKWLTEWPRDREEKFLHFTLYKEDCEQAELFSRLTRILVGNRHHNFSKQGLKDSKYSFKAAGNKDKRARTSQRVAIKRVMAVTLKGAVKKLNEQKQKFSRNPLCEKVDHVAVGNFEYKHNDIDMGDLYGNRFTIVLRNFYCNVPDEKISVDEKIEQGIKSKVDAAMNSLQHKGFINYFGLQRFGNTLFPKTSDVGLMMVKQDWQKVVELILYPRTNEKPFMKRVRAHWWMYRNAKDALRMIENAGRSSIEGILLKGLASCHENDVIGALLRIPKHSLLLYMHAYQALLWNKVVTKRIELFGDKVLVGDLVQMPDGTLGDLATESNCDETPIGNFSINLKEY